MKLFLIFLFIGSTGSFLWFSLLCQKVIPFSRGKSKLTLDKLPTYTHDRFLLIRGSFWGVVCVRVCVGWWWRLCGGGGGGERREGACKWDPPPPPQKTKNKQTNKHTSEGSAKLRQNQCQYCTSTMINMPSETTHFPDRNLALQVGISLYFQM